MKMTTRFVVVNNLKQYFNIFQYKNVFAVRPHFSIVFPDVIKYMVDIVRGCTFFFVD